MAKDLLLQFFQNKIKIKCTSIRWDVDESEDMEEILAGLPKELTVEVDDEDSIVGALSDAIGFCVQSFVVEHIEQGD